MGLAATFGRNLRAARKARGLTIEKLAHDAGLSYSYVGAVERGERNPTFLIAEQLSDALQVRAASLMSEDATNESHRSPPE